MSISKTLFEDQHPVYPGFQLQVLQIDGNKIYINISMMYMNETGWNFSKKYKSTEQATQSSFDFINTIRELGIFEESQLNDIIIEDSILRLNADINNKVLLLPDSGKGYKYL